MTDLPIACTLDPAVLAKRKAGLLPGLARRAQSRDALPDGMRLMFAPGPDVLMSIADVIVAEHECCRFLRFQVTVEAGDGPVTLDVTGPYGTRAFLVGLMGADC